MELYTEKIADEFKEFIRNHPKGHYLQMAEWGKVKKDWKWEAIIARNENGDIVGTVSVLIRKVPLLPYTLMYAPRGPVCDVHDANTFKVLADDMKELAKKEKCYVVKMDSDVLSSDEEFKKIATENGFKIKSDTKNFDGIQPKYVFRLNVEGKTEEEMMASFHSKTRYNIRVAIKNQVEVKVCTKEALAQFVPIMETTGDRDSFITRPIEYFENMSDCLGENMRIYMAYFEGKPIAGAIATAFGDKVWYMYGASANVHRNKMPNYLVQFEMIKWALELDCKIYDFRGIPANEDETNPLYGIYRFKKGFNPVFTEFVGELEYICKPFAYTVIEKGIAGFRKLRHKLRTNKK